MRVGEFFAVFMKLFLRCGVYIYTHVKERVRGQNRPEEESMIHKRSPGRIKAGRSVSEMAGRKACTGGIFASGCGESLKPSVDAVASV